MALPKRLAFHVIHERSLEESLHYASNNNWTGIVPDISIPRFSPEKVSTKERTKLANLSDQLQIEWGFHAPGDDVSLFTSYPQVRIAIVDYFKQIIDLAREVSPVRTNLVIHAGSPPSFRNAMGFEDTFLEDHYEFYLDILCENILELIEYGKPDIIIVLENYKWTGLIHEAIHRLTGHGLRLCLDIPKLHTSDLKLREEDWNIFSTNLGLIEVVHVHDMIKDSRSHQVIGKGGIDFTSILKLLKKQAHNAQYVFEVRPKEAAQESLLQFEAILRDLS